MAEGVKVQDLMRDRIISTSLSRDTTEVSLSWPDVLGYGEIWRGTGGYCWKTKSATGSMGFSIPETHLRPGVFASSSLLRQDMNDKSPYKGLLTGFQIGSMKGNHGLSYDFADRSLSDPTNMASKGIASHMGRDVLSSLTYNYKLDTMDSFFRPTRGYVLANSIQLGGIGPYTSRFVKQELHLHGAWPLGFLNSALNVGVSCGMILPWGGGKVRISDQFSMGGVSGSFAFPAFDVKGVGPTDIRQGASGGVDRLGGDLALKISTDLSFDLPVKFLRDHGVYGHVFLDAGNLLKLSDLQSGPQGVYSTMRSSAGVGLKFGPFELNYCYILQKRKDDEGKGGIKFSFSF